MAALPYFDEIDPSTIDVLLITQYVLPYILVFLFLLLNSLIRCWNVDAIKSMNIYKMS